MRRTANATGRVLVTVGTLLLLFVAYQLWGTGIYEARQQSRLAEDLKAIADSDDWASFAGEVGNGAHHW